jgi:hypothetical protein
MTSPFGTSLRRDASQPRDLAARIDAQIRERIEEAVDFVCLEMMIETRRAAGLPAPAADNPVDREAFDASVQSFLRHLETDLTADLSPDQRQRMATATRGLTDPTARLVAAQASLAKLLPDYWQRFETSRNRYADVADGSSSQRGSLLRRLFGLG